MFHDDTEESFNLYDITSKQCTKHGDESVEVDSNLDLDLDFKLQCYNNCEDYCKEVSLEESYTCFK